MKSVKVSRKSHPACFKQSKNLGNLIAILEKEGERTELFITSVELNGKKMDAEEEKLLDGLSIGEVDYLTINYATISEIVGGSIVDIISSIQDTQLTAIKFCKHFREVNQLDDEKIKFVLIQCRSIIDALEEVFKVHGRGTFNIKHHSLWLESEKELTNILQCILQSRKMPDVPFVADLIEHDLVQALDQWEEVLEKELVDNPVLTGIFSLNTAGASGDNGVDA